MKRIIAICFLISLLASCEHEKPINKPRYDIGSFPEIPVNFEEINTEYDDYNSSAPGIGQNIPLCFSTSQKSMGSNYDIIYKLISIYFSHSDGTLDIYHNTWTNLDVSIENANISYALNKINTLEDELGPYLIPQGVKNNSSNMNKRYESYIFLYSTNKNGNQDIMFTQNLDNESYEDPLKIDFLNSEYDDAYPTFNKDFSEIYFTSNRELNFDIYKVKTDNTKEIIEILVNPQKSAVEKDTLLSSQFDDKCPFILNNFMVFSSNREGGYGGYDLYFSKFENGNWSTPQNFGKKINTEYDEYRPIVRRQSSFSNDFMLFSSNRPGGIGGFDLYYVGIMKISE